LRNVSILVQKFHLGHGARSQFVASASGNDNIFVRKILISAECKVLEWKMNFGSWKRE